MKRKMLNLVLALPGNCARIGARAFAGCAQLCAVWIPASVTEIADDAFDGCDRLNILAPEGSAAAVWAAEKGVPWAPAP